MSWTEVVDYLRVDICDEDDATTVRFAGEMDLESCRSARGVVESLLHPAKPVVVDLSRVTFFGVAGVALLEDLRGKAVAQQADLALRHPSEAVRRVLDLTWERSMLALSLHATLPRREPPDDRTVIVLDEALHAARAVAGAPLGNAQFRDARTDALHIAVNHGFDRPFLKFFDTVVDDSDSACGAALHRAVPMWVSDVCSSPIFAGTPALSALLEAGVRAVASLPAVDDDGRVVAVLSTHHRTRFEWGPDERARLAHIAGTTGHLLSS